MLKELFSLFLEEKLLKKTWKEISMSHFKLWVFSWMPTNLNNTCNVLISDVAPRLGMRSLPGKQQTQDCPYLLWRIWKQMKKIWKTKLQKIRIWMSNFSVCADDCLVFEFFQFQRWLKCIFIIHAVVKIMVLVNVNMNTMLVIKIKI